MCGLGDVSLQLGYEISKAYTIPSLSLSALDLWMRCMLSVIPLVSSLLSLLPTIMVVD